MACQYPHCVGGEAGTHCLPTCVEPPPQRTLTDEVIADLWHQNGFHHHFARAVERWLRGQG